VVTQVGTVVAEMAIQLGVKLNSAAGDFIGGV
jgi:hypothetical protein